MNFPVQIGWPQVILFIVAVGGIALLISAVMSIIVKEEEIQILEDELGNTFKARRRRRHIRWHHGSTGLVMLLIAFILLWVSFAVQEYLGLTGRILVAHVHAVPLQVDSGSVPTMSVELTLYDQNGNPTSDKTYSVNGDEWLISGDIIQFPGWMNILGFHSGYKLTRLEGLYSDPNLESNEKHTVLVLNGGDDSFFETAYHGGWSSFFVNAAYQNGSILPANGISYSICASQDGIVPLPNNKSC